MSTKEKLSEMVETGVCLFKTGVGIGLVIAPIVLVSTLLANAAAKK